MLESSSWRRGRPLVFCDAFARARCGEVGWRLVQKQCARVQFFDALRLHWARAQRCCSVAVSAAISAGYWLAQSWQAALKTCFLLAAVVNAFSVRRILRAFHRRGEDDRERAQLFALIAKACKEQIKSANCTIGRCIDHQSTPLLLRDESFILDCIAADWWESGSPGLIASRAASHCSLSTPSTRRYDSYTRK